MKMPRVSVSVSLTTEALQAADQKARERGTSRAWIIRELVENALCPSSSEGTQPPSQKEVGRG